MDVGRRAKYKQLHLKFNLGDTHQTSKDSNEGWIHNQVFSLRFYLLNSLVSWPLPSTQAGDWLA